MAKRQLVTFKIDRQLMGVDISQVREINRALDLTPVPLAKKHVRGLVNLRGMIVTVFDLGVKLGLGTRQIGESTHNLILKGDQVGLLVDSIAEVVQATESEIEPPPGNLGGIAAGFIEGVVKLDRELLAILSLEKILDEYQAPPGQSGQQPAGPGD